MLLLSFLMHTWKSNADLGSQCGIKKGSIQIAAVFYISGNQFLLK